MCGDERCYFDVVFEAGAIEPVTGVSYAGCACLKPRNGAKRWLRRMAQDRLNVVADRLGG